MPDYYIPTVQNVIVSVNSSQLALCEGYEIHTVKAEESTEFIIKLSRIKPPPELSDGIDFYSLPAFTLVIQTATSKVTFSDCKLSELYEIGGRENILERVTIISNIRSAI